MPTQNRILRHTITNWSAGVDFQAKSRLFEIVELIREKAGPRGQRNNLIKREDILYALGCEFEDLFPAVIRFIDDGQIIRRSALNDVQKLIISSTLPILICADGGVGKTVFIQSLVSYLAGDYDSFSTL